MMLLGVYHTIPSTFNNTEAAGPVVLRYAQDDLGASDVNTADFNLQGNGVTVTKNTSKGLVMTTGAGQASSIFLKEQLAADATKPGFSTYFVMNVYKLNPGPADGYVFIIAANSNSLGESGGGLGYSGITNSIGIEFDFYNNGGENIASSDVFTNGQPYTTAGTVFDSGYITRWNAVGTNALVRAFHTWVEYDHTAGKLELRVAVSNNESASSSRPARPTNPLLTRTATYNQISNFFYAGFTAATGGQMQQMTLKSWYMSNAYIAGGINPDQDTITIDSTPPTAPTITTTESGGNYTMSISGGSDDTGVAGYQYQNPLGGWATYTNPIPMNFIGTYQARTVDVAGNYSTSVATAYLYTISFSAGGTIRTSVKRSSLDPEYAITYTYDDGTNLYFDWYDNNSFTGSPLTAVAPRTSSLVLYGKPVQNVFRIDYVLDGGSVQTPNPEFYYLGEGLMLSDPTKDGHTFVGWFLDSAFTNPYNPEQIPEENFTLYALFSINSYQVTVYYQDDTADFETNTFAYGTSIAALLESQTVLIENGTISKLGYTFTGWSMDEAGLIPLGLGATVTDDLALYGQWTINTYTVTYQLEAEVLYTEQSYEYQTPISFPEAPTQYGFTFQGWEWNQELVVDGTLMPAQHFILQARFQRNNYTLSFQHHNGNTSTFENIPFETPISDYVPQSIEKTGHTFAGWFYDDTFLEPLGLDDTLQATTTLFAKWMINAYDVMFDTQGGSSIGTLNLNYNETLVFPLDPVKEGHTFIGWSADIEGTLPVTSLVIPANNTTLYAQWSINAYTISFDTDGGNTLPSLELNYAEEIPLLSQPMKTGYTFIYWMQIEDGIPVDIGVPFSMPAHHMLLKAVWQINQYTLSFETNGGSSVASITQDYLSDVAAPSTPQRLGYTFMGWFQDEALTMPYTFSTMPAFDLTLYAQWEINQYTVSFNSQEGSFVDAIIYNYNATIEELPTPVREGHTFLGWTMDEAGLEPLNLSAMPAYDVTLYAQWQINTYQLQLVSPHLESPFATLTVTYGQQPLLPVAPVRNGYVFAGWLMNGVLVNPETFVMPASDMVWTAAWTPLQSTVLFVSNDQTTLMTVTSGEAIGTLPTLAIKAGYIFLGWSLAPHDATQIIDASYVVPNGQTLRLYPIWEKTNDASILFGQFVQLTHQSIQSYTYEMIVFSMTMLLGLGLMIAYRKRVAYGE